MAYPFFGGVVTNHLLHGATAIGTRLMPTEFAYVAFWGTGDVYRNGEKIAEDQLVHMMVTEFVRVEGYELAFEGRVADPAQGKTLHLMVPPFKPGPDGLAEAPLKTGFNPFPHVERHLKRDREEAKALPQAERQRRMAVMEQVKAVMQQTKQHVQQATQAGKMNGQPFLHVMFNNLTLEMES